MVDPLAAVHTMNLILKLKQATHKTSVVVTHDTHLGKKIADKLVFLRDGKVAFFGTWEEFEASEDPFLRNFRLQDELIPELDVTV
jgi:ABC-type transporter Mla maintaining outer membrane lipid asymmetry ATPase subunit MlaF